MLLSLLTSSTLVRLLVTLDFPLTLRLVSSARISRKVLKYVDREYFATLTFVDCSFCMR